MKTYINHRGESFVLGSLDAEERGLLSSIQSATKTMDRVTFYNYWRDEVSRFYASRGLSKREIVETIIYQIAQDIHSRKLVSAGLARIPDYRDDLEKIVSHEFPTRRAFCDATGLTEDMLSHVLAKRKHLAVDTLSEALAKVGYRLHIVPSASKAG